jgi:hypothetical protein
VLLETKKQLSGAGKTLQSSVSSKKAAADEGLNVAMFRGSTA